MISNFEIPGNSRIVYDFSSNNNSLATPHGLEIDEFGMLYTAMYSNEIWKINPWYNLPLKVNKVNK